MPLGDSQLLLAVQLPVMRLLGKSKLCSLFVGNRQLQAIGCPTFVPDIMTADYNSVLTQGNLADPLYFDFISFAQFATVSEAMEIGRREFEVRWQTRIPISHALHMR